MSHAPRASRAGCESARNRARLQSAWPRWALAALCLLPLLAVSTQSFWIDEALTALKAAEPSLAGWWQQMVAEKHSDLQMPLYMLYTWAFAQVFGTGEWVLRAANLPWFSGGLAAFALSFGGPSRLIAAAVGLLSAFAWFYLDEARPYAMQLGASLLIVGSIRQLTAPAEAVGRMRRRWVWAFCLGLGVLAGTSLLGVFWCGAVVVATVAVLGSARVVEVLRATRPAWLALGVWLCVLAFYYAWTLKVGARASAAATTNWQSAFYIVYELLGFSGLGPGRLGIREGGLGAFRSHALPLAGYGSLVFALLGAGCIAAWRRERRTLMVLAAVVLGTLAALLGAGWGSHFRLLGRHCAPAFAAVVLLLVAGGAEAWQRRERWGRLVVSGFLLAAMASCLSARFAARHQKDDYRAAAAYARAALDAGRRVWWSADLHGAAFYGLPVSETPAAGKAVWVVNPTAASLSSLQRPDLVVCSKPDLYDASGALAARLAAERFAPVAGFTAFTVWAGPGQPR